MRMGIPAMNSTRTRQLEALLFPSWPERRLRHVESGEIRVWIRWGVALWPSPPFAIGMGWWLGTGWGVVSWARP